ncbi:ecdysteroid-regulated 16 kDa protein-like [Manduca sexta]|uniref:MD-2-related lipid-recognition domain-containing protein n=1 Tax=Manduca sexta TaxID=7130 RepID=A0A921Z335_MANSE|nr:ecdysteroid-regulated 16 kDa protein-like [Manduca sexta]KAG6450024.1 hypothetical protein O3G_MSEX006350 [Manduca sexta]KAG6450025.1 hypothetical protein O3G_MSEX006350 [Manduca sexta]
MFPLSAVACLVLVASTTATDVLQCKGRSDSGLSESVTLTPCKRAPCRLKKGTNQHIKIDFTPDEPIAEVKNHVTAEVFNTELPFVGVDGNSICGKLFTPDGEAASCPLKAGTKYVYKDSFPILSLYPNIAVRVRWSLKAKNKDIVCFEVPAKIVS